MKVGDTLFMKLTRRSGHHRRHTCTDDRHHMLDTHSRASNRRQVTSNDRPVTISHTPSGDWAPMSQ